MGTVQTVFRREARRDEIVTAQVDMIGLRLIEGRLEPRYRLLGVLPLIFFLVQTIHYWRYGGLGNLLWMCNAGNVLLGIGLLVGHRELIRAAAIWTIPGLGIWVKYVLL